eukprot:1161656-Pelagomonas_calceolata.AAC.7
MPHNCGVCHLPASAGAASHQRGRCTSGFKHALQALFLLSVQKDQKKAVQGTCFQLAIPARRLVSLTNTRMLQPLFSAYTGALVGDLHHKTC